MKRWYGVTAVALGLLSAVTTGHGQSASAGKPNFSGVWILNRALSDAPPQPGIGARASGPGGDQGDRAGRGGRGEFDRPAGGGRLGRTGDGGYRGERSGPTANRSDRRSAIEELTSELRNPSASLTISHADPTLAVTNAQDWTRLFQTNGQKDPHQAGAATVLSTTKWDGDRLVTEYDLENGRKIRIIYSLVPGTRQLLEQVSFANGQTLKRLYDPARSTKQQ
jgi:hypothetical protein